MEDAVPRKKIPSKPIIPQKNKDKKPFERECTRKEKLNNATHNDLRMKKHCFIYKDPWELEHRCMGKVKMMKAQAFK